MGTFRTVGELGDRSACSGGVFFSHGRRVGEIGKKFKHMFEFGLHFVSGVVFT
jgi:hypothetical protein